MRRRRKGLSVRLCLLGVALLAVGMGLLREARRVQEFDQESLRYGLRWFHARDSAAFHRERGQDNEAADADAEAQEARELSDWYHQHRLLGGRPPVRPGLAFTRGWMVKLEFEYFPVVVIGKVVEVGADPATVSLEVTTPLKGPIGGGQPLTADASRVPETVAHLVNGQEYIVFLEPDATAGYAVGAIAEHSELNRRILDPLVALANGETPPLPVAP